MLKEEEGAEGVNRILEMSAQEATPEGPNSAGQALCTPVTAPNAPICQATHGNFYL